MTVREEAEILHSFDKISKAGWKIQQSGHGYWELTPSDKFVVRFGLAGRPVWPSCRSVSEAAAIVEGATQAVWWMDNTPEAR